MRGTKEIQRRIKSVRNTKKITRAMEMVSAAKMKKAVSKVLAIRAYAHAAWGMLQNLSIAFEKQEHGLLEIREVKKILVILVSSNRGLCGAYNAQIIKKMIGQVKNPGKLKINKIGNKRITSSVPDDKIEFDFISVGKKGFKFLVGRGYNVTAEFEDLNFNPALSLIEPLAKMVIDDYTAKKYDKVVVAYTDFRNTMIQEPKLRQILPISKIDLEKQISEMTRGQIDEDFDDKIEKAIDYKFEPKPAQVLEQLLPRLVEMQLYHSILESNASRESARMMAMKNATEAASEMLGELQYSFNQVRQMNITQEIAEITSGRVALE